MDFFALSDFNFGRQKETRNLLFKSLLLISEKESQIHQSFYDGWMKPPYLNKVFSNFPCGAIVVSDCSQFRVNGSCYGGSEWK